MMKPRNLLITLLATCFPIVLLAQQKVYPITIKEEPNEFYVTQMRLWKSVTETDPQNKEAWWNLYLAARYKDFPRVFSDEEYREEVNGIIDDLGKALPGSYEYHYLYAWQHGFGKDNYHHLQKAYAIDSTRPKITEDLFTHHYRQGEWDEAEYFIRKWYNNKNMAPQLMYMCYNLLVCTEKNGILFLSGDNDSFPTWMLQQVRGVRPDVAALNTSLILDLKFARKILARHQLKYDESALDWLDRNKKDLWKNFGKFVRHLAEKNPDRRIYLVSSVQKQLFENLQDNLYIVGSVFQYCEKHFDNIAVLKKNWTKMNLDYLDFIVYGDDYHYSPKGLPYTVYLYLYPASALYKHYQTAGENQKAAEMLEFCKKRSLELGKPDLYKRFVEGD